jgi:putative transposase
MKCLLFAIHITTRRVIVLGVTRNPDSPWATQQARNLAVGERLDGTASRSETGTRSSLVLRRSARVRGREDGEDPDPSSEGECSRRAVGPAARAECLDSILILGRRHLERVLKTYA